MYMGYNNHYFIFYYFIADYTKEVGYTNVRLFSNVPFARCV